MFRWPAYLLAMIALLAPCGAAMAATEPYDPPLSAYMDLSEMPGDAFTPGEGETQQSLLDRLRVREFNYAEINENGQDIGATVTGTLTLAPAADGVTGLALALPGVDAFELVTGTGQVGFSITARETEAADSAANFPMILELTGIDLGIRLKGDFLRPAEEQPDGSFTVYAYDEAQGGFVDSGGGLVHVELSTAADLTIRYTWDGETEVDIAAAGGGAASFAASRPFMIAETGIVVSVRGATLDLSTAASPAQAPNAAWQGVVLDELSIAFTGEISTPAIDSDPAQTDPDFATVALSDFLIGTGGFSGKISGNLGSGADIDLGGMDFALLEVSVGFQQNALTAAGMKGRVESFPFFDQPLVLDLSFDLDGNFRAGIAGDDPNRDGDLVAWDIPSVARIELDSVAFQLQNGVFYTEINGGLVPLFFDGDVSSAADSDPRIPVNGLRIGSDGTVALDGGWVTLPEKRHIDFNAFRVELSAFGLGLEEGPPGKKWIGFSGGVELVEGLSASAKFKKFQVSWIEGQPGAEVTLRGVEVSYEQPGVIAFAGSADWFDEPTGDKGFAGTINADLQFIKTSLDARLVIGKRTPNISASTDAGCITQGSTDPFKFFFLDVAATLPAGIPVFSGISLYGIEGLLALNVSPNLCAFEKPLLWYEAHRTSTNVIAGSPPPWVPEPGAFAVGLGVMLGTTPDDGYAVNAKVALTVAVPGPVVMLTGAGNVIKQRGPLNGGDDPVFTAIAVFDGRQQKFLVNLGVFFKLPESGLIYDISATAEASFDLRNPDDWYLHVGKDVPEEARIRATVLQILTASSYHMLDNDGTKFGARSGYDSRPNWKFGPLKVTLGAWFGFDTAVSWRPVHVWGQIDVGGIAELKAFGFGVGLSAEALLAAQTPSPFAVEGSFKVKLNLPWPLPDPKATVKFSWQESGELDPVPDWIQAVSLDDSKSTHSLAAPLEAPPTDEANNGFTLPTCTPAQSLPETLRDGPACAGAPMVEVTARPVVAFRRDANNDVPSNDPEQVALQPLQPGHYLDDFGDGRTIRYALTSLRLLAEKRVAGAGTVTFDADSPMDNVYGAWPALLGLAEQPGSLYVRIWSKNPFTAYDASTYQFYDSNDDGVPDGSWEDWFAGAYNEYPCSKDKIIYIFGDATKATPERCAPADLYTQEDLILPPYHSFSLDIEGNAAGAGTNVNSADYEKYAYFYTEGPPLALDPFVFNEIPGNIALPHYRDYAVGLRFNETYLDLLYKEPGPLDANSQFKDPNQLFTVDIVDENDQPVIAEEGAPFTVDTSWVQAPDHISTRSEEAWIQLMVDRGTGIDTGLIPTDDMVYGQPTRPETMRGGQRYTARFWLEDPRLAHDGRVTDTAWKEAMGVRFAEGDIAMLYSFAFTASRFRNFTELVDGHGGGWFPLDVAGLPASVEAEALAAEARMTDGAAAADNSHAGYLGRSLARLLPGQTPETLAPGGLEDGLMRVPNYVDDPAELTEAQQAAVFAAWADELAAFDRIDEALGTERRREALPEMTEVSVLRVGGTARGFLIELPEPVDWARIGGTLTRAAPGGGIAVGRDIAIVPNATGTRAFVFDTTGGALPPALTGDYRIELVYAQSTGSRNPILSSSFHPSDERPEILIDLLNGAFPEEAG